VARHFFLKKNQPMLRYPCCWLLLLVSGIFQPIFGQADTAYARQHATWHRQREAGLAAADGWLNLAGRFVLAEGSNSFGAHPTNRLLFPKGRCADFLGDILLKNDSVWVIARPDSGVLIDGRVPPTPTLLFPTDTARTLQVGVLRGFVIRRGTQHILRLRDLEHPALRTFAGVPTYPLDTAWRVTARLEPGTDGTVAITNVLGITSEQPTPGTLVFVLRGRTCRLTPIADGGQLFLIFADETSGLTTYGTGRFLYAPLPDAEGRTTLDFNYAISPPCAFTEFATCPLPPRQNALPLAVTAGEKNVPGGH
jgi:uncharacterized protein